MNIAIDFDGTCVTHEYPNIGEDIGAESVLRVLIAKGHNLILNTMRSGDKLNDAINWFKIRNIPLFGVGKHPTQDTWTSSNKAYADIYIDDSNINAPMKLTKDSSTFYLDWKEVSHLLYKRYGIFSLTEHESICKEIDNLNLP